MVPRESSYSLAVSWSNFMLIHAHSNFFHAKEKPKKCSKEQINPGFQTTEGITLDQKIAAIMATSNLSNEYENYRFYFINQFCFHGL